MMSSLQTWTFMRPGLRVNVTPAASTVWVAPPGDGIVQVRGEPPVPP